MPLDSTFLDYIRDGMADSLPTVTAALYRNSPTIDAGGAKFDQWFEIATYAGRVTIDTDGREDEVAGRMTATTKAIWSMRPYASTVTDTYKVKPQDRLLIDGVFWDVLGDDAARSSAFRLAIEILSFP